MSLKLFCVLLAICLWAYVKYTQTPLAGPVMEMDILVPLQTVNQPHNVMPLRLPDNVVLTVRGSPDVVKSVKPEHFKALVDLRDRTSGTYALPIDVKYPPGVEMVDKKPAQVSVKIEPLESKIMKVKIHTEGKPASGFVIGNFQPLHVKVLGASSLLEKVKDVVAEVDVSQVDTDIIQKVTPMAVDAKGNVIRDIILLPGTLRVNIPVRSEIQTRVIPISPQLSGTPPRGFVIKSVSLNPPVATVLFSGKNKLNIESLSTERVDINGISSSFSRKIKVLAPAEISLVSGKSVQISIEIVPKYN